MRFDIPVPCFFGNMDFCHALYKIKELGFDAAETYNWKELDLEKAAFASRDSGVEIVSMCTSEFRLTDSAYRNIWLEGLRESVAAAKKVGAKRLITQVGNDTGEERARQHESIVETLTLAKPILEDSGVTVMLEPLNTLYDHRGYYLQSSTEGFEIIKEVGSPFVKLIYDIYHQQVTEGNIINNIRDNIDCISHFHAAGHPGRHELQYGENDYKVIFDAIDKTGFKGCCGLEYSPLLAPEESLTEFKRLYG